MSAHVPERKQQQPEGDICPDCGGELVPTHWLTSVGEYPVKEVVKIPGKRCKACECAWFDYDPHAPKDTQP